ncbi:MAG: sulfatase-like hydrolase/transferase [Actinomycetota bacterium]
MTSRTRQPNILLITTDQEQSFVDLPASLTLPAHERLRGEGVAFRRYQVNSTPCGPSRAVLYTGQHTQHTRMFTNPNVPPQRELSTDIATMGSIFRDLGYHTVYKGKWHLSNIHGGPDHGGQRFIDTTDALEPYGFSEYTHDGDHHGIAWDGFKHDASIAGDAANWLNGLTGHKPDDGPWLMAVNFVNPHDIMFYDATGTMGAERLDPLQVAPLLAAPHAAPYTDDLELDLPASFQDDLSRKPTAHLDDRRMCDMMFGLLPLEDVAGWRSHRNYYFNCIRDVDRHVETVLAALDASGEADNTIVVFTSDHGEMAGAHGMRQKGASMYKENIGVSLMIRHPDGPGGVETDALATSVDVIPTMLDLAGFDEAMVDERWPALTGVSLAGALAGSDTARDRRGCLINYTTNLAWDLDFVEALFGGNGRGFHTDEEQARLAEGFVLDRPAAFRGIRTDRYKFARYFAPSAHHTPTDWDTLVGHNELELYDLAADPDEVDNLGADPDVHRDLILSLSADLNALVAEEVGVDDGSCYSRSRSFALDT